MRGESSKVSFVRVVQSLAWRELARFFRQRNRVIGAIGYTTLYVVVVWPRVGS